MQPHNRLVASTWLRRPLGAVRATPLPPAFSAVLAAQRFATGKGTALSRRGRPNAKQRATPPRPRRRLPTTESAHTLVSQTLGYDAAKVDEVFHLISGQHTVEPAELEKASEVMAHFLADKRPVSTAAAVSSVPEDAATDAAFRSTETSAVPQVAVNAGAPRPPVCVPNEEEVALEAQVVGLFRELCAESGGAADVPFADDNRWRAVLASPTVGDSVSAPRRAAVVVRCWLSLMTKLDLDASAWGVITPSSLNLLTVVAVTVADGLASVQSSVATSTLADARSLLAPVKEAADAMDTLWQYIGVPPTPHDETNTGGERSTHPSRVNHRTTFSSLNHLLRFQWEHLHRRRSSAVTTTSQIDGCETVGRGTQYWMAHPGDAFPLLHALQRACHTAVDVAKTVDQLNIVPTSHNKRAPVDDLAVHRSELRREVLLPLVALTARTLLDVDTHLSVARAAMLKESWCVPVRLNRASMGTDRAAAADQSTHPSHSSTDEVWSQARSLCMGARVTALKALHDTVLETVTRLTPLCSADRSTASPQVALAQAETHNLRVLVSMVKRSLNAALRRHYLETASHKKNTTDASATSYPETSQTQSDDVAVYIYGLHTFLMLRDVQASLDGAPWRKPRRGAAGLRQGGLTCGTQLSQAVDVMFFLHLFVANRWFEPASSGAVGSAHTDSTSSSTASVARLIAPARVDSYIHEVLCDLQHNTAKQLWHLRGKGDLFYFSGLRRDRTFTLDDTMRQRHAQSVLGVVHAHVLHPSLLWMPLWQLQEVVTVVGERPHLFGTAGEETHRQDEATAATSEPSQRPARVYPMLQVGSRNVTLTRLHCYLVLRLFVVGNVLRACRGRLLASPTGGGGSTTPLSPHAATRLRASAVHEPSKEQARRQQRDWAAQTVSLLLTAYPTLAAEVEGVADIGDGHARALARLESTTRYMLDRHLVIKASDILQTHRTQRRPDSETANQEDTVDPELAEELASLDFIVDEDEPSPKAASAEEAAVSSPPSSETTAVPVGLPASLVLRWTRPTLSTPLGFSVSSDGRVLRVNPQGGLQRAAEVALGVPQLREDVLLDWKVVNVNGQPVADGRALVPLLKDACDLVVELTRPPSQRERLVTSF